VPLLSPKVPFQNKWRKKTKGKPATKMEEVVGVTYTDIHCPISLVQHLNPPVNTPYKFKLKAHDNLVHFDETMMHLMQFSFVPSCCNITFLVL